MTNKERNLIKKKILKCLTEDFKNNQALFDKKEGQQVFNGTEDEKEFCVCCTCNITKGIEGQNNYCSMCDHYF